MYLFLYVLIWYELYSISYCCKSYTKVPLDEGKWHIENRAKLHDFALRIQCS